MLPKIGIFLPPPCKKLQRVPQKPRHALVRTTYATYIPTGVFLKVSVTKQKVPIDAIVKKFLALKK